MTISINRPLALDLLNRAVAQKGADHVVDRCRYINDEGQGDCIVGTALSLIVPEQTMRNIFDSPLNTTTIRASEVQEALVKEGIIINDEAMSLFSKAQRVQDGSEAWGEAVRYAVEGY